MKCKPCRESHYRKDGVIRGSNAITASPVGVDLFPRTTENVIAISKNWLR
jgi:hypothetical protein